jgi:hypothetical protein
VKIVPTADERAQLCSLGVAGGQSSQPRTARIVAVRNTPPDGNSFVVPSQTNPYSNRSPCRIPTGGTNGGGWRWDNLTGKTGWGVMTMGGPGRSESERPNFNYFQ